MEVAVAVVFMSILGAIFAAVLNHASKIFHVEKDPREEEILSVLPGANCGACGYPGCSGYAAALVKGEAEPTACAPGGAECTAAICSILGIEAGSAVKKVAVLLCQGHEDNCGSEAEYYGPPSCSAAVLLAGGAKKCPHGCLGLADCVRACPFDAIRIGENGLPIIDREKCTGCGKCVEACPRNLLVLLPHTSRIFVACKNTQKGAVAIKVCETACIGCGKCKRACPFDAITIENFLARIDPDKCRNCGKCVAECPRNSILDFREGKQTAYIQETCTGCEVCKQACPFDAIEGEAGERHKVNPAKCTGCRACVEVCEANSIIMRDE